MMLGAYAYVKLCLAESMSFIGGPATEKDRSEEAAGTGAINTAKVTLAAQMHADKSQVECEQIIIFLRLVCCSGRLASEQIELRRDHLLSILLRRTSHQCR
jgi:hypothetical protein